MGLREGEAQGLEVLWTGEADAPPAQALRTARRARGAPAVRTRPGDAATHSTQRPIGPSRFGRRPPRTFPDIPRALVCVCVFVDGDTGLGVTEPNDVGAVHRRGGSPACLGKGLFSGVDLPRGIAWAEGRAEACAGHVLWAQPADPGGIAGRRDNARRWHEGGLDLRLFSFRAGVCQGLQFWTLECTTSRNSSGGCVIGGGGATTIAATAATIAAVAAGDATPTSAAAALLSLARGVRRCSDYCCRLQDWRGGG